jgi:cold-inducible RNA-binding protein
MSKKLFVGGLAWATDDAALADAFGQYGSLVEAKVVKDRDTGRSRGFGFVTYEDEGSAASALEAMNGQTLDGRTLRVDLAQEQGQGGGGGRRERSGGGGGYGRSEGGQRRGGGDRQQW